MVPSTTRGVSSLLQMTEVAGPPVEVQIRVCVELLYVMIDIIGAPVKIAIDVHVMLKSA